MEGLQIVAPGAIESIEKTELFENVDSLKIKITKTLITEEDFNTFNGDPNVNYPIIPGRIAVGKVAQISSDNVYGLEKGDRVFLHSVTNCNKCFECTKGNYKHCTNFQIAGKNTDGYLRNFAVKSIDDISELPATVSDQDSIFIAHVAIADHVIDSIGMQKGERVLIVGANLLGIILSQLIIYYQGVPILLDTNRKNLELAKMCGVYYTRFIDNKIEKYISDLTSTHMAKKVVYMSGSNINTDVAIKLASYNATVCFAGFETPNLSVNFNIALKKQLNFKCITNGFDSFNSAINLIANQAIDTSCLTLDKANNKNAAEEIRKHAAQKGEDCRKNVLLVDMD
ncbi:MAG: alcohol dehydrogenase catalytic domain-containing protein [Christensenellaceae bacterium]